MKTDEKNRLIKKMMEIEQKINTRNIHFEKEISEILIPLLKSEEYLTEFTHGPKDNGVDIVAHKVPTDQEKSIKYGIECKNTIIRLSDIQKSYGMSVLNGFDRIMVVTSKKVSESLLSYIKNIEPISIEIIDFEGLKKWIGRIETESDINYLEIQDIIKAVSKRFASMIADDPMNLYKLEWRELERVVAEIFDGIGFKVQLTPCSKDGGKDVILECTVNRENQFYIIEIKHWRSGQKVGQGAVKDFLNVIVKEKREAGLYLSTFGYCDNAFEGLTEIEKQKIKFGSQEKIVSLCQTYLKITSGIWSPSISIPEILFEKTIN